MLRPLMLRAAALLGAMALGALLAAPAASAGTTGPTALAVTRPTEIPRPRLDMAGVSPSSPPVARPATRTAAQPSATGSGGILVAAAGTAVTAAVWLLLLAGSRRRLRR
jgi:hypothetical protein